MDADRLLMRLCERHGLDPEPLQPYVPLVRRALVSPEGVRNKILMMVEESLARRAEGDPAATVEALEDDLDEEVLRAVAQRLHGWTPKWREPSDVKDDTDPDDLGGSLPEGLGGVLS